MIMRLMFTVLLVGSASAQACLGTNYQFGNLELTSAGQIIRELPHVEGSEDYAVERLQLSLGDQVILNASGNIQDVTKTLTAKFSAATQPAPNMDGGTQSAVYDVTETTVAFETQDGKPQTTIEKFKVTVSHAIGTRGCGEVTKIKTP